MVTFYGGGATCALVAPKAPNTFTGLINWCDASIFASLSLTGADINSIADQSGTGTNMTWTGFGKPTYNATGFNTTYPTVQITTAVGSALEVAAFPMGTGNTLTFFVVSTASDFGSSNEAGRYLSYSAPGLSDSDNTHSWCWAQNAFAPQVALSVNAPTVAATVIGVTVPGNQIVVGTIDSSGVQTILINGVFTTGSTSPAVWTSAGKFAVGRVAGAAFGHYITANFCEWGVITSSATQAEMCGLWNYLKAKWGL